MPLEVSARKVTEKKNHGEKSVQKLEKSVTLPSGSRSYKIFWSTFWSSLRIIWEFLILQDIVGIVPIGKSLKSFFHFWGPKKPLTGHHGKVYKIKMQTRFSYGFPNQILKSLFKKQNLSAVAFRRYVFDQNKIDSAICRGLATSTAGHQVIAFYRSRLVYTTQVESS